MMPLPEIGSRVVYKGERKELPSGEYIDAGEVGRVESLCPPGSSPVPWVLARFPHWVGNMPLYEKNEGIEWDRIGPLEASIPGPPEEARPRDEQGPQQKPLPHLPSFERVLELEMELVARSAAVALLRSSDLGLQKLVCLVRYLGHVSITIETDPACAAPWSVGGREKHGDLLAAIEHTHSFHLRAATVEHAHRSERLAVLHDHGGPEASANEETTP